MTWRALILLGLLAGLVTAVTLGLAALGPSFGSAIRQVGSWFVIVTVILLIVLPVGLALLGAVLQARRSPAAPLAGASSEVGSQVAALGWRVLLGAGRGALAGLGLLALAAVAWVWLGRGGVELVAGHPKVRAKSSTAKRLSAAAAPLRLFALGALAPSPEGKTVYRDKILIERRPGRRPTIRTWRTSSDPLEAELAEFAWAVAVAYDHLLMPAADKRPKPGAGHRDAVLGDDFDASRADHRISIRRAWRTSEYLGLVVGVGPAALAHRAASFSEASLIPSIDAGTRWTKERLEPALFGGGLSVSDSRMTDAVQREGTTGLFVSLGLTRAQPQTIVVPPPPPFSSHPILRSIEMGLVEQSLPRDYFRLAERPRRDFDSETYRFTATRPAGGGAYDEILKVFENLRSSIRFVGKVPLEDIRLFHDDRNRQFVLAIRKDPPPFPGEDQSDGRTLLVPFLQQHAEAMRKTDPRRFCAGLDYRGEPVWVSLATLPSMLVAGTINAGKSVSGVFSPLIQLATINSPADLGFWIVDSKEEAFLFFAGLPHTRRLIKPDGLAEVLDLLQEFADEAKRRRAAYRGQNWQPGLGDPALILVIEEWLYLVSEAEGKNATKLIEQVVATLRSIQAISRSVGCGVILATQDPKSETLPSTLANLLPAKMATYGISDPILRVMFGDSADLARARIPKGKQGRLAIDGAIDAEGIVQAQALWSRGSGKPPPDIAQHIRGIRRRWADWPLAMVEEAPNADEVEPTRPAAQATQAPAGLDDADAEWPDIRLVDQPAASEITATPQGMLTLARVLWSWKEEDLDTEILVSRDRIRERLRSLGLRAPRDEKLSAAMGGLRRLALLNPASDTRFLTPSILGWSIARARVLDEGNDDLDVDPEEDEEAA